MFILNSIKNKFTAFCLKYNKISIISTIVILIIIYLEYKYNNDNRVFNPEDIILNYNPPPTLYQQIQHFIQFNNITVINTIQGIGYASYIYWSYEVTFRHLYQVMLILWRYIFGFNAVSVGGVPVAAPVINNINQEAASGFEDMSIVWTLDNVLTEIFIGLSYIVIIILAVIIKRYWYNILIIIGYTIECIIHLLAVISCVMLVICCIL
jgi:hypothetical protein